MRCVPFTSVVQSLTTPLGSESAAEGLEVEPRARLNPDEDVFYERAGVENMYLLHYRSCSPKQDVLHRFRRASAVERSKQGEEHCEARELYFSKLALGIFTERLV